MTQETDSDRPYRKLKAQLAYIPRVLALVWQASRGWTLAWIILLVVQGVLPGATVTLTRTLVDSLVDAMDALESGAAAGTVIFQQPLMLLVLMAFLLLLAEVLRSISAWVRTAQAEIVHDYRSRLIQDQATTLDMGFYESPAYFDLLYQVRVQGASSPLNLLESLGSLAQNVVTFITLSAILLTYAWWLPVILLCSALPGLLIVLRYTIVENRWRLRNTADMRRSRYYEWLVTERRSAAEIRLFELGDRFKQQYQSIRHRLRTEKIGLARSRAISNLMARGMSLGAAVIVLIWVAGQIIVGLFSLGDLAMFYQVLNRGQLIIGSVTGSTRQIYSNLLYLENLFEFLDLKPTLINPKQPQSAPKTLVESIRFQNITFRYPESERVALENFNLTIPAGKIVAIVGGNGAGKSTLIKLLCRFYDPQQGSVTLDGIDVRDLALTDLRRKITALFQQQMNYHATVAENIEMGNLNQKATTEQLEAAAAAAGADGPIARLSDGYETLLGKWFGGSELSGGEWQRLALARAFLRQAPIIALDEPTSAMDSWAEADWMARFRTLAEGRTVMLITHRFTTAMQADIIHVMVEGKLIESGSHEALLALDGHYAESWRRQISQNGPAASVKNIPIEQNGQYALSKATNSAKPKR